MECTIVLQRNYVLLNLNHIIILMELLSITGFKEGHFLQIYVID